MGVVVLTCTLIQEVGQQAAHDSLVADNQDVLLSLQLHDDRLHPLDQVLVGLESGGCGCLLLVNLIVVISNTSEVGLRSYVKMIIWIILLNTGIIVVILLIFEPQQMT